MMKRAHIDELYTAYLEGTLTDTRQREVEAHLRDCPRCAAGLAEMRALVEELRELPTPPLPVNFAAGVRARISERPPQRQQARWLMPALTGGTLAAAAMLMLIFGQVAQTPVTNIARLPETTIEQKQVATRGRVADDMKFGNVKKATPTQIAAVPPTVQIHKDAKPPAVEDNFTAKQENMPALKTREMPELATSSPPPASVEVALAPVEIALAPPEALVARMLPMGVDATYGRSGSAGPAGSAALAESNAAQDRPQITTMADASIDVTSNTVTSYDSMTASTTSKMVDSFAADDTPRAMLQTGRMRLDDRPMLEASKQKDTDGQPAQVLLRVNKQGGAKLAIQYVSPPSSTAQQVIPAVDSRDIALILPDLPDGAVLKLTLDAGTGSYHLIIPRNDRRQEMLAASATRIRALDELRQLSDTSGKYLFYPTAFIEQAAKITTAKTFDEIAKQAGYRVERNGEMTSIVPL